MVQFDSTLTQSRSHLTMVNQVTTRSHWTPYEVYTKEYYLLLPHYTFISTVYKGNQKRQGILCRVNVISCPRDLRPMGLNASSNRS